MRVRFYVTNNTPLKSGCEFRRRFKPPTAQTFKNSITI